MGNGCCCCKKIVIEQYGGNKPLPPPGKSILKTASRSRFSRNRISAESMPRYTDSYSSELGTASILTSSSRSYSPYPSSRSSRSSFRSNRYWNSDTMVGECSYMIEIIIIYIIN